MLVPWAVFRSVTWYSSRVFAAGLVALQAAEASDTRAAAQSGRETIRGEVQHKERGPCNRLNCEWMTFDLVGADGRHVTVHMEERIVEGTVFEGHEVEVDGRWNRRNQLRADRITDLTTGATIGFDSLRLRYPEGRQLSLIGHIQKAQEKEPPGPGQRDKKEKLRFLLRVRAERPADDDVLIPVEVVKRRIIGFVRNNQEVRVIGEWTARNVLRADTVRDELTGAVTVSD
ncbi:MAG: hypothetical protein ACRD26_10095 [Vicinamibacterales bacterium]